MIGPKEVFIEQQLGLNSIELLNINLDHIAIVATLPLDHRDPFDQLLIARRWSSRYPF